MKDEKGNPRDIRDRTYQYSLRAIRLFQSLQEGTDRAGWELSRQYLRSATSIGANIEEAQSGESRADFLHKYGIAQKEARETLYWLRLMADSNIVPQKRLSPLLKETGEIISVITAIIVKTKRVTKRMVEGIPAGPP